MMPQLNTLSCIVMLHVVCNPTTQVACAALARARPCGVALQGYWPFDHTDLFGVQGLMGKQEQSRAEQGGAEQSRARRGQGRMWPGGALLHCPPCIHPVAVDPPVNPLASTPHQFDMAKHHVLVVCSEL